MEIGLGVTLFLARNSGANEARRAIVIRGFITYVPFFITMLLNISGDLNAFVWLNIALYLLLALGIGYFAILKRD